MPLRQQDSVCAQIIPCSSWLFSIFLNRHYTESGIRNGPVISLIASTDKSKMGKFFQRHNWFKPQMFLKELSGFSPTMVWSPLSQPSPQGWARTQMAERAPPPDRTHLHPIKASTQKRKQEVEDNMFLGICPLVTLKLTPSLIQIRAFGEPRCHQELLHPNNILNGHVWTANPHSHDSRCHRAAGSISDLTDLKTGQGLSLPRILRGFSKFLLSDLQGNRQVLWIKR